MAENSDPKSSVGESGELFHSINQQSAKEDDRESIYSSTGSLSFVITEDIEKEMTSYMTQSQYSKVHLTWVISSWFSVAARYLVFCAS